MPKRYDTEAWEYCKELYLRYSGQQHDRIEREMRRKWPGWSKQNLYTRGNGPGLKDGWIDKFGWERALEIHLSQRSKARGSDEEALAEVEEIRKKLYAQLKTQGTKYDRDLVYQHRDYTKLYLDARVKLGGAARTLKDFVAVWEKLLDWLTDISPDALREMLKVDTEILERAAAEYGEEDEADGGGTGD